MQQFYTPRGFLFVVFCVATYLAPAQNISERLQDDPLVSSFKLNQELNTPSSIFFQPTAGLHKGQAEDLLRQYFQIGSGSQLHFISETKAGNQVTVLKYKQVFKNVPVEHSMFNVVIQDNKVQMLAAEAYKLDAGFSVAPQLPVETGKANALKFVNAKKYAWEAIEEDKKLYPGNIHLQMQLEALKQQYLPKAELVIAKDQYGSKGPRLAYKFSVMAVEPVSHYIIYVDAIDGKILLRDAVIKHVNEEKQQAKPDHLYYIPNFQYYNLAQKGQIKYNVSKPSASVAGTGQTRYSGTRVIYTSRIDVPLAGTTDPNNPNVQLTYSGVDPRVPVLGATVYHLRDDTKGGGIETYDCNSVGGVPLNLPQIQAQATAFVDRDNNWKNETDQGLVTQEDLIRGASSNGTDGVQEGFNDDIAIDAHWGAGIVYDYWKNIHNRLSFDNKNSTIRSYIHYGPAYDNAFWNGSSMTYGDGSGTLAGGFRPLVSLDVCGHEIAHGVCSFTSDLVYESESGAMNEGLSDIWAAAVERYAKINVDPTLAYEYFQVGEQISPDNIGLRRMDNPKALTDPDTYGGRYWRDPNCTPSLANDQCGVHTNSGVLNKWFYLVVQGPGTTTGTPAYTDDGIADGGTTAALENTGNNYGALSNFIGIGFDKAEQITYLMELALTPNAKFADAREASINVAKVLYGPCSQEVITVTNAWFGVNVGAAWSTCTAPTLSVNVFDTEVTEGSGSCGTFTEYTIGVSLAQPQTSATTINFTTGGTAEDHDFDLTASEVTFTAGETGNKTIKLRVYNDDMVEGDESIVINATSSLNSFSFNATYTIIDDDVLPRLGNTFTILTENFESVPDDALPTGWSVITPTNPTGGLWNVRQSPGASGITWLTKRAYVYDPTLPAATKGQALYNSLTDTRTILRTSLIDARGLDSIRLQFVFSVGGEGACDPACDYGQVVYSLDGVNFQQFDVDTTIGAKTASEPLYLVPVDSTYNQLLPRNLSNRQFYIGFQWVSDALATIHPNSITIDNVVVTGQGRKIETDSGSTSNSPVFVEAGNPVFFYSESDNGLLSKLVNASAALGCVKDSLVQAGPGTVVYSGGQRTRKVHEITPAQNNNASYTLTLYYTAAELQGFTAPPSQLRILKSNAANIDQSNASNSVIVSPVFIDSSAQGFYGYEYTFNGFSKFALVEPLTAPLPVTCLDFKAVRSVDKVNLFWSVGNDVNRSFFELERSSNGSEFNKIGTVSANGQGKYIFTDKNITGLKAAYYRIKEINADGSYQYLCTVLYVALDGKNQFTVGNIYPNPGKGNAQVNINVSEAQLLRVEYVNTVGQVLATQHLQLPAGASQVSLSVRGLAAGSYLVRFRNTEGKVVNTQQFIRQ